MYVHIFIDNDTYYIPIVNVEGKINMKVLMVVIVEDSVGLPGLPPVRFEVNARMVDDAVVVSVQGNNIKRSCKN